jgi:hypothetical protein
VTTYYYEPIAAKGWKSGKCAACGKRAERSREFRQTLNPFNLDAEGTPKTSGQIWREVVRAARAWGSRAGAPRTLRGAAVRARHLRAFRAFLASLARAAATRLATPDPLAAERARDFDAHVDAALAVATPIYDSVARDLGDLWAVETVDDVLWLWGAK